MEVRDARQAAVPDTGEAGDAMYALIEELYPICRSITGEGMRETFRRLQEHMPLEIHEVPSGTRVFDWTVPKEWNIQDAYVKNPAGERVIDFHASNLHVLNYSVAIHRKMSLSELRPHLHTLPDQPQLIPYRTSYYDETWGFCLSQDRLMSLQEGEYEVCIDSSLKDGHLTYAEYVIQGELEDEVLISCHSCHPSLCNDNLSGVALATYIAKHLRERSPRYSYRFLFIPGTIGSITWLALNERKAFRIRHGLVAACVGDGGPFTYKKSRRGDARIDRVVEHVLRHLETPHEIRSFSPYGYDERQYCSPGFNLAIGCLSRTPHGCFPEYHTSADNLDLVTPRALQDSLEAYLSVLNVLEEDAIYVNVNPKCEPQLGRRGLYRAMGGHKDADRVQMAMLWVLNLTDGEYSLLDIAQRSGMPFRLVENAARMLHEHELLDYIEHV